MEELGNEVYLNYLIRKRNIKIESVESRLAIPQQPGMGSAD